MSLTRSQSYWHEVYEALPTDYRTAIDEAFRAMSDTLRVSNAETPLLVAGDDRAEALIGHLTQFVVNSNPDNAAIQSVVDELELHRERGA